jgi:signal transduction histidine kinase
MLERQLQASFENRLEAGLETFSLILKNRESQLIQGLSRMAWDNTLQMTLNLEIIPQLRNYLETQIKVLGFSVLSIADVQNQVVVSIGNALPEFIDDDASQLIADGTDILISHTNPIYRDDDLLGYVRGAVSLREGSFVGHLREKLVDHYAIWVDGKLIVTDLGSNVPLADWELQVTGNATYSLVGTDEYRIRAKTVDFGASKLSYGVLFSRAEQRREFWTMVGIIGAVVMSLFGIILLILRRYMRELIVPVTQLTKAASHIDKGNEIPYLDDQRTDELGQLAIAFKRMVKNLKRSEQELRAHRDHLQELVKERTAELETTHRELVQTARKVGMAEVATGVMHNVGNVLNSVGVTTASITKMIRNSRTSYLSNVVKMIEEHANDLGAFLTTDDRGRRVPAFLTELSRNLTAEQEHLLEAVEKLTGHVQHITEIVNLQQSYGKISGLSEPVLISELVEDAVRINGEALIRHDIEVKREYAPLPVALFDRPKVLQIMTNLISNAKYAVSENGRDKKILILRIKKPIDGQVRIEVADNGIGIAEDNLTHIFSYGFTTRKDGHGFGLHSGALAAKEMGGSLTADSDGPSKGATFTLALPYRVEGNQGCLRATTR